MAGRGGRQLFKVILLGDSYTGKTSLLDRFVNKSFSASFKATIGADFLVKDVEVGRRFVTLQIWDTAGTERFSSIGSSYFRGADACLLVYDVSVPKSFEDVEQWRNEFVQQAALDDPLNFPFVIVGNKLDCESLVPERQVAEYCSRHGSMLHTRTSAKDGTGVDSLFTLVAEAILKAHASPDATDVLPAVQPSVDLSRAKQEPVAPCCSV